MTTNPTTPEIVLPAEPSQFARTVLHKPMRELLELLRQSPSSASSSFSESNAQHVRAQLADSAATVMAVCNNGMASIGHLLAHSAPVIEDGTIGADTVEALGWLLAELGDMASFCMVLAVQNRCPNDTS
jgi:hypothetical protein